MKKILILFLVILFCDKAYCDTRDIQNLDADLEEILHIEKILVEGVEYDKDDEISNASIKSVKQISSNDYEFSLTPFTLRIKNNLSDSILVSADFEECCSCDGSCSIDKTDLKVEPSSRIINNPYNMIESDFFTPKFVGHKDTRLTRYRGKLIITLGKI